MSIEVLKKEARALEDSQRRELMAFLVGIEIGKDDESAELRQMMDDKDPAHWVTLDELDRHLGLKTA